MTVHTGKIPCYFCRSLIDRDDRRQVYLRSNKIVVLCSKCRDDKIDDEVKICVRCHAVVHTDIIANLGCCPDCGSRETDEETNWR
jgi:Zn finger protein HypA/HybF involved in hydrogenase expression